MTDHESVGSGVGSEPLRHQNLCFSREVRWRSRIGALYCRPFNECKGDARNHLVASLSCDRPSRFFKNKPYNRPFARSGHMVRNKLCWDINNSVGPPKQRNSYQFSPAFLCLKNLNISCRVNQACSTQN